MVEADFKNRDAFDPDDRELCPDGNCIGVLDANGVCKVCGKRADGTPYRGDPVAVADPDHVADHDHDHEAWSDERELCPDGNCTGLIGADRKCKVCGITVEKHSS